jgi:hypothetical protein
MNSRVKVVAEGGGVLLDQDVYRLVLSLIVNGRFRVAHPFKVYLDGVEQSPPPDYECEFPFGPLRACLSWRETRPGAGRARDKGKR